MDDRPKGLEAFLAELKRRRVYRAGAFYIAASFVAWQVAEIAVPALGLPDVVLTVVVAGSIGLFPFALIGAWLFDIRLEREESGSLSSVRAWLAGSRLREAALIGVSVVLVGAAMFAVRTALRPSWDGGLDEATRIAVFPLATVALDDASFGEGIAELLNVGLDGIPGLDVLDPSAFWAPVLEAGIGPSLSTERRRYLDASRRFGVDRFLTGTVILAGSALDVSVRVHDGRTGAEISAVRASAVADSLSGLVDELIVGLVAELWDSDEVPEVASIERFATSVPQALQSYLEAMRYMRRGDFNAAEQEIERAVEADSTFALAHLAQFRILSWRLRMAGEPMVGLQEIVRRAYRHRERLTPRGRRAVAASVALDETMGDVAIAEVEQILAIDPADVEARTMRAFTINRYGWQFGQDRDEARRASVDALALDSLSLPLLELRVGIALRDDDFDTAADLVARMNRVAPESPLTVGNQLALDLLTAPDEGVDSIIDTHLDESLTVAIHVVRKVRMTSPSRALAWSERLMEAAPGAVHRSVGQGSVIQILLAAGALSAVDSLLANPAPDHVRRTVLRGLLAADLMDLGDRSKSERAVSELADFAPADSFVAHLDDRPEVWAAAWAVGAWHAAIGDTATARRYRESLALVPRGGIPPDWAEALAADIESRLARRRGDLPSALEWSRTAFTLWSIHDPTAGEWYPEPAIRFHRAELLEQAGEAAAAAALYQSFVHSTWAGFYTPLAALRLGRHMEETGDEDGARFAYRQAVMLWEMGDPALVGPRLEEARRRLEAL